jgi:hypothetical protein
MALQSPHKPLVQRIPLWCDETYEFNECYESREIDQTARELGR